MHQSVERLAHDRTLQRICIQIAKSYHEQTNQEKKQFLAHKAH